MTNPLKIYSGSNALLYTTPINTGCRRRVQLMNEDSVTVRFSDERKLRFPVGSRLGDFYITDEQQPKYNASTGGYDYELRFNAYYWLWANRRLFYVMPGVENAPKETSFRLTATIDIHAAVILRCLQTLGFTYDGSPFRVDTDEDFSTEAKYISYADMSVLGGIQAIAEAYECEWWVVGNAIHFGKCAASGEYDFTVGENVVSISSSGKEAAPNRLFVFGSTRNLPPDYRRVGDSDVVGAIVEKRLMLPEGTPFLQLSPDIPEDEIVEKEVKLDNVYPRTALTISKVKTYSVPAQDGKTQTFYRIKYGDSFKFSKEYILPDEELHIVFESGDLHGMDFAVKFNPLGVGEKKDNGVWNPEAQMFEIVANEDYGRSLPDETLHPEEGDRFSLYGWDSTKMADLGLLASAEQELKEEGEKLLGEYRKDLTTYTCPMMWDWCKAQSDKGTSPRLGSVVTLHFVPGDEGRKSRIIGFEHDLDIEYSNVTYTCGEKVSSSRLKTLESKVDGLIHDGSKVKFQNSLDFLSKRYADRTPYALAAGGRVTAEKGVQYGAAFAEGPAGFGGYIDGNGNAWLRNMRLEESLFVPELVFNRTVVLTGFEWQAPGGGTVETCEGDTVTLKLENGEPGAVEKDDLCMGIWHFEGEPNATVENNAQHPDATGRYGGEVAVAGFTTVWFRVSEVIETNGRVTGFRYVLREGHTARPMHGMRFVAFGNPRDKERQTSRYRTRTYERFLRDVTDWTYGADNIAMQIGDLSGLNIAGRPLAGYSAYLNNVYMSGTIKSLAQQPLRLTLDFDTGATVSAENGVEFRLDITKGGEDFTESDEVTVTVAIEGEGTEREVPVRADGRWFLVTLDMLGGAGSRLVTFKAVMGSEESRRSAVVRTEESLRGPKGDDALEVKVVSDGGNVILNGQGTRTLTAFVWLGGREITDDVPAGHYSWERMSSDPADDAVWNRLHEGTGNVCAVTAEDIDRSAVFVCRVTVEGAIADNI